MKLYKRIFYCLFSLLVAGMMLYADILYSFPKEINMHLLENHKRTLGAGVSIGSFPEKVCVLSGADTVTPINTGSFDITLNIGSVPFRMVKLNITEQKKTLRIRRTYRIENL